MDREVEVAEVLSVLMWSDVADAGQTPATDIRGATAPPPRREASIRFRSPQFSDSDDS